MNFILHIKNSLYLVAFTAFSWAYAGSFEDFFKALKFDDAATVQRLLARGFDANTVDENGQHGLLIALRLPALKVAATLVDAPNIDLNALNQKGESALMLAALKGQEVLAEKMVQKGADVNKTGWTPLHYAASTGQQKIVAMLLLNHAYIDAESPNGTTPLMMASMYGSPEVVKLLLEEGADPSLKNEQGLTALQFAQSANRPDAAQLLSATLRLQKPSGTW